MINEISTAITDIFTTSGDITKTDGISTLDAKNDELINLQTISKSLDRIEKNLSYQNHLLYIDTIVLSAALFFTLIYRFFKIFI